MARESAIRQMLLEPRVKEFCELEGLELTGDTVLRLNERKALGVVLRGDFEQAHLLFFSPSDRENLLEVGG